MAGHLSIGERPRRRSCRWFRGVAVGLAVAVGITGPSLAQENEAPLPSQEEGDVNDFAALSLEQLMNIEVTSVEGVGSQWFDTPAALTVITGDDIRRTGHTSLAEALRLAPGLHVAQINSSAWAINSRGGFGNRFSNSLLVLIDGRPVYDPIFSGVLWDQQDLMLEDLDRIEVIRGPGATLWGSNAVNGVINVTTRSSRDTQGWLISGGGGNLEQGFGAVRYGGKISDDTHFRIWGKYFNRSELDTPSGDGFGDDWDLGSGGFRFDLGAADDTRLIIDGGTSYSERIGGTAIGPVVPPTFTPTTIEGDDRLFMSHLLARLEHTQDKHTGWSMQASYTHHDRDNFDGFTVNRDELNVDLRHYFQLVPGHNIVWGLGTLRYWDRTEPSSTFALDPPSQAFGNVSAFVQDTITLAPDRLFLMAGTKIEYNDFSGFEVQPSARLWWTPTQSHTIWGAVSRPVRTPSRSENAGVIPLFPGIPPLVGNPDLDSVKLMSYEVGYRQKITPRLTIDLAGYYNRFDRFIGTPAVGLPEFTNDGEATAYGAELAATWQIADNWRLQGSYTFNRTDVSDIASPDEQESFPEHQFQIRSSLDITKDLDFDTALYFYDRSPHLDVDAFFRLDAGLTWRPRPNVEVAIWGQNLLDDRHAEFHDIWRQGVIAEVPRSVYARVTLRF